MKKVVVIGAGTSGLAAAIRLQTLGYQVEIYEKNDRVGGRMYQIEDRGFSFDVGPTIVMLPEIYKEVFAYSGANPDDYIEMQSIDPMHSILFPDGTRLNMSSDLQKMTEQLEAYGKDELAGYIRYLSDVYLKYQVAKDAFLDRGFRKPTDFFNMKGLSAMLKLKTLNSAYASVSKYVSHEKLRKALSFQTLYIGISPYAGPSIYTIITMIEILYGVWYIKGGMYAMARAMERRFLELGGIIHLNHPVDEIIIENKKAIGIRSQGKIVPADIMLTNADFPWAVKHLIKERKFKGRYQDDRISKMKYSSSAFILYLGLDCKIKTDVHSIRFADDFDQNIRDLFQGNLPKRPSYYVYSPSQIDPSVAPDGKELLYVLVPVPSLHNNDIRWDDAQTKAFENHILDMLEEQEPFKALRKHIEVKHVYTPSTFEKTFNLQFGSTFGLRPTMGQSVYFRPQSTFKHVDHLYFTGSSTHPGAGVPIVMMGAKIAVSEIQKDHPL